MNIKRFMVCIPGKLGIPKDAELRMSRTFELLFDDASNNKDGNFKRLGNSLSACEDRLDIVFSMIDGAIKKYNGNIPAGEEAKRLLLLSSTADKVEHIAIVEKYGDETEHYSDVLTNSNAMEIGVNSWWND